MMQVGFGSGHVLIGLGEAPGFVSGSFVSGYRFSDSAVFRNQTPLKGAGFHRTLLRAASHFESHEHPNMVTATQERFFFEHYGLTNHDLQIYLTAALSAGGDYADLYFEYLTSTSLMVDDSLVKSASQGISAGCGVRVVSGQRTGYAYTDDISSDHILHAARTAALIANVPAKALSARFQNKPARRLYPVTLPSVD